MNYDVKYDINYDVKYDVNYDVKYDYDLTSDYINAMVLSECQKKIAFDV